MSDLRQRFPHYSKLLALFPAGYRADYSEQMLQTLADMLDDPEQHKTTVWARTIIDFPISLARQQLVYVGETMNQQMPTYIKRTSLLGAWLVAPFFVFLFLSAFSRHGLENSFFWHTRVLFIWLILLPSVAIILNLVAWLRWIHSRRLETKQSVWRTLIDIKYSWPAIAAVVVGLGILALVFGHDSVHCVTGNPVRELHNPSMTWQCIQQK